MTWLKSEAAALAEEGGDLLRLGEAQLAIARAHLHVSELRDPGKYEAFARLGLNTGENWGRWERTSSHAPS